VYGVAQSSGPFAVHDPHGGQASHKGVVEILIETVQGFFDAKAAQQ
jgi:hypothetical protein